MPYLADIKFYLQNLHKKGYSGYRPDIIKHIPENATSILDVGCGEGGLGKTLKEKNPAINVAGIDGDPNLLEKAKVNLDHVIIGDLNAEDIFSPLEQQTFDVIIFADVLEHLYDPHQVLMLAKKYLNNNGTVIISLPNIRHWSTFWYVFVRGYWPENTRGIFDKTHINFFARKNILTLIDSAGFQVVKEARNLRIIEPWSWTNIPAIIFDFWPFRSFVTFQYIHVCKNADTDG